MFFSQKLPLENFIFRNYLYPLMLIYTNHLIQQLNLPNTFVSTAHPNSYLLITKLEQLSATETAIRYLNCYLLPKQLILPNMALSFGATCNNTLALLSLFLLPKLLKTYIYFFKVYNFSQIIPLTFLKVSIR